MLYQRARADQLTRHGAAGDQVITPRRIRLYRAPDLAGYRQHLVDLVRALDPARAADTFVAGADPRCRRTTDPHARRAALVTGAAPLIGSRADLYDELIARLPSGPRMLSAFEREAMLAAGAREAEESGAPRAVSRASGADRRDAGALRSHSPPGPHRRRLRSPAERRARARRRIRSRRAATARANPLPRGRVSRLRSAPRRRPRRRRALGPDATHRRAVPTAVAAAGDRDRRSPVRSRWVLARRRSDVDDDRRASSRSISWRPAACSMRVISIDCSWRSSRSRSHRAREQPLRPPPHAGRSR